MKYLNNRTNYPHGVMFHHFHNEKKHPSGQGSIDKDQMYKLIKFIGRKNILDAQDFNIRLQEGKLKNNQVCLTFDDGIKSQYDIALPLLEDLNIKSFFFVYGSLFTGKPDLLEVYRFFRLNFFEDINQFYNKFNNHLDKKYIFFLKKKRYEIQLKKRKQPFYSLADLEFRAIRNEFLSNKDYKIIMSKLFEEKNFIPFKYYKKLFMSEKNLVKLDKLGHEIGLHSFSHPTIFSKLPYSSQLNEYKKNLKIISKILKKKNSEICSMSHPCGSYNSDTVKVLKKIGIKIGFKNIMEKENKFENNNCFLEIPRQNHSDILTKL